LFPRNESYSTSLANVLTALHIDAEPSAGLAIPGLGGLSGVPLYPGGRMPSEGGLGSPQPDAPNAAAPLVADTEDLFVDDGLFEL
jgi:hypothetical protein